MNTSLQNSCLFMVILSLGLLSNADVRPNTTDSTTPNNARHEQAISLLRVINTGEQNYKIKHGTYATWSSLMSDGDFSAMGSKWVSSKHSQSADLKFSSGPEILPGWALRLNPTADGNAYDLLLEDTTDKKCGYAAITDERGVIRQGLAIDCEL